MNRLKHIPELHDVAAAPGGVEQPTAPMSVEGVPVRQAVTPFAREPQCSPFAGQVSSLQQVSLQVRPEQTALLQSVSAAQAAPGRASPLFASSGAQMSTLQAPA